MTRILRLYKEMANVDWRYILDDDKADCDFSVNGSHLCMTLKWDDGDKVHQEIVATAPSGQVHTVRSKDAASALPPGYYLRFWRDGTLVMSTGFDFPDGLGLRDFIADVSPFECLRMILERIFPDGC